MTFIGNSGQNPEGKEVEIPVSGNAATAHTPLGAGQSWSSGWLDTRKYGGIQTFVESDVKGSYTISYSNDGGQTESLSRATIAYMSDYGRRAGKFAAAAPWMKFDYKNNGDPQTLFYFKIDLLVNVPEASAESINAQGALTRTASWNKTILETYDDQGVFDKVTRTGNSLNVHVDNPGDSRPLTSADQVTVANQISGFATSAKQLPDNHQVIANPPSRTPVPIAGGITTTTAAANQKIVEYTVPTGKTFYLEGSTVSVKPSVLGSLLGSLTQYGSARLIVNDTDVYWFDNFVGSSVVPQPLGPVLPDPLPFPAGTKLTLQCSPTVLSSTGWQGNIFGYTK